MNLFTTPMLTASLALAALTSGVLGQTRETVVAGAAVTVADRSAGFGRLSSNGVALSDYTEDRLFIGTDGDSWVGEGQPLFDPFHGADAPDRAFYFPYGGSPGWTEIRTTDHRLMYAVEFMYGNGWTTGDIYGQYPWGNPDGVVTWETWRAGSLVSSGNFADTWYLQMGTVIGWLDRGGFDTLLVRCTSPRSFDPNLQALALDNLRVQLTPPPPPCAVDFNGDGFVDFFDYDDYVLCFESGSCPPGRTADVNGDDFVDFFDYDGFVTAFQDGC